jgi:site-specific recombinase XerD
MATVYYQTHERKTGKSYQVYYADPLTNRPVYYKSFRKKKDAQAAMEDLRAKIDNGGRPQKKKKKVQVMTFSQVAESLQKHWQRRLEQGDLARKSEEEYRIRLNKLCRKFGQVLMFDLSSDMIQEHVNEVARTYTNVTANKDLQVIQALVAHGFSICAITHDPCKEIKRLSEAEHERSRFLMVNELNRLVEAAQQKHFRSRHYMPALIYLGAEHGASIQECLSLGWQDIDFDFMDRGLIHFRRSKNRMKRTAVLMPRAKQALWHWRQHVLYKRRRHGFQDADDTYVFSKIKTGEPFKRVDHAFKTVVQAAGIEDFRFHDLRHTYCSSLVMCGVDLKTVREMIGHKDLKSTDRYAHLVGLFKEMQQRRLDSYYNGEILSDLEVPINNLENGPNGGSDKKNGGKEDCSNPPFQQEN